MKLGIFLTAGLSMVQAIYALSLQGKIVGVLPEYKLQNAEQIVNGNNLPIRFTVELTSIDGEISHKMRALVNSKYEFIFNHVNPGIHDLSLVSHDFILDKDRFRIEANHSTITATDYYLNGNKGQASNVTDTVLVVSVVGERKYYEVRSGSVKEMLLNSPLGFIFKNTGYTIMFVATLVMMAGPYVLSIVNPEMSKRLAEIREEQGQGRGMFDPKPEAPKIEEISRSAPARGTKKKR
ncbi:hypothetical protein PSN45_002693 [Yamadazyma tenuis]|uniref:ER membrane protein complex subunit 7 beta-sandwich domain-containing protein n=1 Tax=Candida tenuis (strain ATCC 10573 / BCRC 21748 / CBS 615 / JCM 9827 / NBRC 10315 / NRRL Y-1498 / VKM Y-70) TaxID=590646 RepID=G3AX49_CANTC|nr:uncharacterized protein CANTEDRAFT_112428 [Yamadazyma tenuis ATCC 10573]XP_006684135.1 uncharacterized protein CANTEDRAFT_112428 [Yamadazyma tenuis ATCC 10573]EGV66876.1 hypothetical protein CANTEDRAFT_112428 [Yamadazyma tenuis ATCC 10573]EGV66877.1 hypothetical protein CANTEDRAFT_112428 [Yamadazyma tenuis ATCC 10573]WEJ95180.1 hypothetical protein PSN45_002693 [Yamadazyma tenuis]